VGSRCGRIALSYTRNILELRRAGAVIENRIEMQPDGSKHGFYRMVVRRPETSAAVQYWQDAQPQQADLIASPKPTAASWRDPEQQGERRRA
jgi:hypothetical protein